MDLPFTEAAFLDAFGRYNKDLLPLVIRNYFRGVNPAAIAFGALFVAEGALFVSLVVRNAPDFVVRRSLRGILTGGLVTYGLAYPFIGLALGLAYPRLPLFAVPCPTTVLTAGFLLASAAPLRLLSIAPALWAGIGASAALSLGVAADWALIPAGLLLTLDAVAPTSLGPRS